MEADSTTHESNAKDALDDLLPFSCDPRNLTVYKEFLIDKGKRNYENTLVAKLQNIGLLPSFMSCPTNGPNCKVTCKSARVIDRVQWVCEGCGKRQPIRTGSFFFKLQCSIIQALQIVLAWSEDVDPDVAAECFDVKPRKVNQIYDKLDELAIKEFRNSKLGGQDNVVLTELYPDCLNRLSPDTSDQPHVNRVLMIADTKHIPTFYRMHVINEDLKKASNVETDADEVLRAEVARILPEMTAPECLVVTGSNVPTVPGTVSIQQLMQHCDADMQHFLSSRVWRQALTLCAAARGARPADAQKYLDAAAYRLRYDGYYSQALQLLRPRGDLHHTLP